MCLGEFDIIKKYFMHHLAQSDSVVKSIGDDCAVLALSADKQLVMSMDTVVAGRHFPENTAPYHIATRALCTSLSDLAAMGAKPLWFTLGLTLPGVSEAWLEDFSRGLFAIADPFNIALVGGDTTKGPLTITIQVHGEVDSGQALLRSGAQTGDAVFVTGCLGDGAAGLALLQQKLTVKQEVSEYLQQRFYAPAPQIIAGQHLAPYASAAIDISDGLLADAEHIALCSQVDMLIHVDQLPLAGHVTQQDKPQYQQWALSGGDDYQLLFSVAPEHLPQVRNLMNQGMIDATCIGEVCAPSTKPTVRCLLAGNEFIQNDNNKGYQHFAS